MAVSISNIKQDQVDLKKIKPLERNRLVVFINHFIDNVTAHCNELIYAVDSRLSRINRKLNICEVNLLLLEYKLNSIPGLSSITNDSQSVTKIAQDPSEMKSATSSQSSVPNSSPTISEPNEKTANDHPIDNELSDCIAKYRKMLQVGVPYPAVQQKMKAEGIDPDLLKI